MDWNTKTIRTYDKSAEALATYFGGIGARIADIERGLGLAGSGKNSRVIEIGCGDGRDASEIIKRADWYEGFDPSNGLLAIARHNLPATSFVLADALTYNYPKNLDVIFAFASLLHVDQQTIAKVFKRAATALRPGGVFYISLKEREKYSTEIKQDKYGQRMFYYYNIETIQNIAGKQFATIYSDHQTRGGTNWFTIALKRKTPHLTMRHFLWRNTYKIVHP